MVRLNDLPEFGLALAPADQAMLGRDGLGELQEFLQHVGAAHATRLVSLPDLAQRLDLGAVLVKDEGGRLGLGSFKALGGAYAVATLVREAAAKQLGRPVAFADLDRPEVRAIAGGLTFGCATDGNHGRSVAWGAQLVGAKAVIFVHGGVSAGRVDAIASYGAEVVRVAGSYDDSVADAARVCGEHGWTVVSDTSWPGYEQIPALVMQGYTRMVSEALGQVARPPTHVFIQAGVGGVAAAVAAHCRLVFSEADRPRIVVVEPARAACVLAAAEAGEVVRLPHGEPTVMAMLECQEASRIAWRVLARSADAFMTVDEADAVAAMRCLAWPGGEDQAVTAGESGAAGLAGLLRVAEDGQMRAALGLDGQARVLLFVTEGATDPARYRELVA
ncbi:MAG TPA: diaminopropionate ammonia-lyase [Geminicoccus sp.]|uniref:diaminopropionate ammonia-lyase n=1 Tax=Geminicoccus sp. TaxID=2024832 RepID=UPI002C791F1E|nr:diaminopropionate ammonia-lyase [Geminicoccus sp.]HWL69973.1 diaminopropionate ammonia-lyase [Geminicoccus sp.]